MEPRDLPEPDDRLARFRVTEPLAVRACLRALRDQGAPLALHASPAPRDARVTGRLAGINTPIDRIEIATDAHADSLQALARTRQATVVAFADRVKIQFVAAELQCVAGDGGRPRLRALLPQVLYRVQRRDTFRVQPALRAHCALPWGSNGGTLTLAVLDASIGGVSLRWPAAAVPAPVAGQRLEDCMVSLPGVAAFRCDLLVRSVGAAGSAERTGSPRADPAARAARRVGCAFESLSQPMQRTMQRFVFDTDKCELMRARAGGFAQRRGSEPSGPNPPGGTPGI